MISQKNWKIIIILITCLATSAVVCIVFVSQNEPEGVTRVLRSSSPEENTQEGNFSFREKREYLLKTPLRHLDLKWSGVSVGHLMSPLNCPPPPVTRSLEICYPLTCKSHQDCRPGEACCFNGCIHTCLNALQRPAAFDWVEDTSKIHPILGDDFYEEDTNFLSPVAIPQHRSKYAAVEGGREEVLLAGGCTLSATRYEKLKIFMKAPSIKTCRCSGQEVVCDIKTTQA